VGRSGVVEANLFSDDTRGLLLGFETMTMHTLLLQRSDQALDHAALLRAVRRDEPLTVASHHPGISPRREDQPVIRPYKETGDRRLLQRSRCRGRSAASRELPAQHFSRVTVDDERQGLPAIMTCPDAAQIGRPAFVRRRCHRGQCLDSRSMPDRSLARLPAHQLEDPLNGVLVETQKAGDSPITERGLILDHLFDRRRKSILNLRLRFHPLVVHRTPRNLEPTIKLRPRNSEIVFSQAPMDL
jgi:hypothetical protein